jgi:hypothetical protein
MYLRTLGFMSLNYKKKKPWKPSSFACVGAFSGMGIAAVHHINHALSGNIPQDNPLAHIFLELGGFALGAALLLAAIAVIRNRVVRHRT